MKNSDVIKLQKFGIIILIIALLIPEAYQRYSQNKADSLQEEILTAMKNNEYGSLHTKIMKLVSLDSTNLSYRLIRAQYSFETNNFQQCYLDSDFLIEHNPGGGYSYFLRALSSLKLNKREKICSDLTSAINWKGTKIHSKKLPLNYVDTSLIYDFDYTHLLKLRIENCSDTDSLKVSLDNDLLSKRDRQDIISLPVANSESEEIITDIYNMIEVDVQAEFYGGKEAISEYVTSNIEYPYEARENEIEGKVYVRFVINKDCSVSDVIIARTCCDRIFDKVSVDVIKNMPDWEEPAYVNERPVKSYYVLPINFAMEDSHYEEKPPIDVKLFPNPVTDILNISVSESLESEVNFSIFSLDGKQLQTGSFSDAFTEVDVSNLEPSTYRIVIKNAQLTHNESFVKL